MKAYKFYKLKHNLNYTALSKSLKIFSLLSQVLGRGPQTTALTAVTAAFIAAEDLWGFTIPGQTSPKAEA